MRLTILTLTMLVGALASRSAAQEVLGVAEPPGQPAGLISDGAGVIVAGHGWVGRWSPATGWTALPEVASWNAAALALHDDGAGPACFLATGYGPDFFRLGESATAWDDLGRIPVNQPVNVMLSVADGPGAGLYAGGTYVTDGEPRVARWDGAAWELVGTETRTVNDIAVFDDGGGETVYIAGDDAFVSRLEAGEWVTVGGFRAISFTQKARGLAVTGDGVDARLWVGGHFSFAGGWSLASWDGVAWSGASELRRISIEDIVAFDDGAGSMLYLVARHMDHMAWEVIAFDGTAPRTVATLDGRPAEIVAFEHGVRRGVALTGDFDTIDGISSPGFAVVLSQCDADADEDGELSFFDFLAFQNLFAARDPQADLDGDGEFTFFDFLAFQNEFAAGCP